ncbi:MAG: hypothetical protein V1773_17855 [bacterium]
MIFVLFIPLLITAQTEYQITKGDTAYAIINYCGTEYLLTNTGVCLLKTNKDSTTINDFYTDYYRRIYNDSTLQNPNYIQENNDNQINIFPLVDVNSWINNNLLNINSTNLIFKTETQYLLDKKGTANFIEQLLKIKKSK